MPSQSEPVTSLRNQRLIRILIRTTPSTKATTLLLLFNNNRPLCEPTMPRLNTTSPLIRTMFPVIAFTIIINELLITTQ